MKIVKITEMVSLKQMKYKNKSLRSKGGKTFKKEIIPLQGKDIWQSWAALDKELN